MQIILNVTNICRKHIISCLLSKQHVFRLSENHHICVEFKLFCHELYLLYSTSGKTDDIAMKHDIKKNKESHSEPYMTCSQMVCMHVYINSRKMLILSILISVISVKLRSSVTEWHWQSVNIS